MENNERALENVRLSVYKMLGNPWEKDAASRAKEVQRAAGRKLAADSEQRRLREILLPKKHRRLYMKLRALEKHRANETRKVQARRIALEGARQDVA